AFALLARSVRHLRNQRINSPHILHDLVHALVYHAENLSSDLCTALFNITNFACHHAEAAASRACTRRFDRRIQGQRIVVPLPAIDRAGTSPINARRFKPARFWARAVMPISWTRFRYTFLSA